MKNSKTCPKCGGTEIYTDAGNPKRGDRTSIPITSWGKLFLAVYICAGCGYLEEYVEQDDLSNSDKMDKLKKNFNKA
ncbi:hypothetical protein K6119_13560 [Paracrocinitomix mangrovi]|uniref:hypothetical protein n=1 Tax=Paracrocinitomix mangrovi TaxID=2862509 RepID=UPI001C8D4D8A|nr:hypothetical protein [Paracrocinitomix mangrovi]UKN00758.1 hypothetical protein K6119_13560 [Paracrocinitomix mangrovi]